MEVHLLKLIAPSLYVAETTIAAPGGGALPARMTVVRLEDGALALISPIRIDDALGGELEALGPVSYLLAPNCFHHLFAGEAKGRWPSAQLLGAPGLAEKRKDLRFDGELTELLPRRLQSALDATLVGGAPRLNEVALFHRATGTLILTDFVFNLDDPPGLSLRCALTLLGTRRGLKQSRLLRFFAKDRAALQASAERVLAWPAERVVMAHGALVEEDVATRMRAALWWSLRAKRA